MSRLFLLKNFISGEKSLPKCVVILVLDLIIIGLSGKKCQLRGQLIIMNQNVYQMNQNVVRPQYHSCFKCKYEAHTIESQCPRCGKRLYSATNIRVRGVLMTFIGLFLTGLMGTITIFVTGLLINAAKNPSTSSKLNEEPHMLYFVYAIFGGVIALGITAILAGLWQMIFGKRNMFLIWIFMGLLVLTLLAGGIFRVLAG